MTLSEHLSAPYRPRDLLCDLGPTCIKAGQILASRPDIVRGDYMEELQVLQARLPASAALSSREPRALCATRRCGLRPP